jgi:hypothetical protein
MMMDHQKVVVADFRFPSQSDAVSLLHHGKTLIIFIAVFIVIHFKHTLHNVQFVENGKNDLFTKVHKTLMTGDNNMAVRYQQQ